MLDKVLKGAHANLKESHAQLQVKLTKENATLPHMVLNDNAKATNPCCEHVHLVEENAKMKEQLGEANDMIEAQEETISKMDGHSRDYAD